MKIVPTYRLLLLAGFVLLPGTLLIAIVAPLTIPVILMAVGLLAVSISDARRSRERLQGIDVILPEVVRLSVGRPGSFDVQIENERRKIRHMRLGLAFPEQIDTPTFELAVELPKASHPLETTCHALLAAELNIHYAYPLLICPGGRPAIALYVDDPTLAAQLLLRKGFRLLAESDLKKL